MTEIILFEELERTVDRFKKTGHSVVLTGGCFDILHIGHIKFLKEAKKHGDYLMVLLESDETVNRLKGENRPYFSQAVRAEVLSAIKYVDIVVILPPINKDEDYEKITLKINPDVIAITANDPHTQKKRKQAEMVGGKLITVPFIKTYSSSRVARLLGIE